MNPATIKHDLAIEKIKESKNVVVDNIFDDDKLSIIEKLTLISQNDLLPLDSWIQRIVPEEIVTKFNGELQEKYPGKDFFIIDEISLLERDRHEKIDMAEEIERLLENLAYNNEKEDATDEELLELDVEILSCRSGIPDTFKMKGKDYVQLVYDWVKENRKIGFEMDW